MGAEKVPLSVKPVPSKVSIIVTTYNWEFALSTVLDSLALQSDKDFEVVIADDGSAQATKELVADRIDDFPVPLSHSWHEDKGFRAAAARNRAVSVSRGDYLVFLDGDCAVFPNFVETHIKLAEAGCFVAGNRVLLSKELTAAIIAGQENVYEWSLARFMKARLAGEINRVLPLLRLPDGFFRKLQRARWQGAKTCNLGIWRDDFYLVNGFDESFVGWGHEDAELVSRLIHTGIIRKDGRFATAVMHLWHEDQPRDNESQNMRRLLEHLGKRVCVTADGIGKY